MKRNLSLQKTKYNQHPAATARLQSHLWLMDGIC
jgi:hypothetical protein